MNCAMFDGRCLFFPTALSCSDGDLRLVNGFTENEGTLEVCKSGAWNTVCQDGFKGQEAYVACRQMGLNASSEYNY